MNIRLQSAVESKAISTSEQQLVDLLLQQAEKIRICLENIDIDEQAAISLVLETISDELECLANASQTAGFSGLAQTSLHVIANVQYFISQMSSFTVEHLELFLEWIVNVQDYLPAFKEDNIAQLLVFGLNNQQWPLPLLSDQIEDILRQISFDGENLIDKSEIPRASIATDKDVSLLLPDDVNPELLELLLQELPVHTQEFSVAVHRLQSVGSEQDLEAAQRAAHTLKGCANTVGITGIAVLTHHLEDILTTCASEGKLPSYALTVALITAADCLEIMSEVLAGETVQQFEAKSVLQEILDWANRIDQFGLPDEDEKPLNFESGDLVDENQLSKDIATKAQASFIKISTEQIESLFKDSGECFILNNQFQEHLRSIKNQMKEMRLQFSLLQQLSAELGQLIDLKDFEGVTRANFSAAFEVLEMDQYSELHTVSRRMAEAASDAQQISMDVNLELDKIYQKLDIQQATVVRVQDIVMQTRLLPVVTINARLQRNLRQTCRMTNKQARLDIVGEHIQLDSQVLNSLVDPLMHILRNAIDHGIESPDERLAKEKSATGHIEFEFDRVGNDILIYCRDDGQGLDYPAIRAAAEKRGLLQPGDVVSEKELDGLIMRPNFSSRNVTTQTSGRGVGMDVIHTQIVNLGGSLNLNSLSGQGLTIEIRVPLPLSMTHALLTQVGPYNVAIANKGIMQIVYAGEGELVSINGQVMFKFAEQAYQVFNLYNLLQLSSPHNELLKYAAVLLVNSGHKISAVLVGDISGSQDIVIKNLGLYLDKLPGYIGATILGNGAVTPVLDLPQLVNIAIRPTNSQFSETSDLSELDFQLPTVLLVDDSLSQRRSLELLLTDSGFKVSTARDGMEAVDLLCHFKPDVVLTDLEMPRMNGIELIAHMRNNEDTKLVPIIMMTSRSSQKHRQLAEETGVNAYFTKPVLADQLLKKIQNLLE